MEGWVNLIDVLIWPITLFLIYIFNYRSISYLLEGLRKRIINNAPIDFRGIKIGSVPSNLPNLGNEENITKEFFGLIHSSWRYPRKDKEYGFKMYGIQVILMAQTEVLDQVQYVKYYLHNDYPNPIQTRHNREDQFELKELAWGEFNLKAEVKLKNNDNLIELERYINLTETGDRLLA